MATRKRRQPGTAAASAAAALETALERTPRIASTLARLYPGARISLDFATPWQCLVATILSAQCTDQRVNELTPELFRQIPDIPSMAAAPAEQIRGLIVRSGFFRQKTRALQATARALLERFGGNIPDRMEDLVTLPGVGRKTANLVVTEAFGKPGICVDTHVHRISNRWGLVKTAGAVVRPRTIC